MHVRHDGIRWSSQGGKLFLYDSSLPTVVLRLEPAALPVDTDAILVVHAQNLHPSAAGYACKFRSPETPTEVISTRATFVSAQQAKCAAPSLGEVGLLEVILLAANGTADGVGVGLQYFDPAADPHVLSAAPASGEVHAGTLVTLRGRNFGTVLGPSAVGAGPSSAAGVVCLFGDQSAAASVTDELALVCRAPRLSPGEVALALSLNGGRTRLPSEATYTSFDVTQPPLANAIAPLAGHIAGSAVLNISGANFAGRDRRMVCEFWGSGTLLGSTAATVTGSGSAHCPTPATSAPSDARVRIKVVDGLSSAALSFTFFDASLPPTVMSFAPKGEPLGRNRSTVVEVQVPPLAARLDPSPRFPARSPLLDPLRSPLSSIPSAHQSPISSHTVSVLATQSPPLACITPPPPLFKLRAPSGAYTPPFARCTGRTLRRGAWCAALARPRPPPHSCGAHTCVAQRPGWSWLSRFRRCRPLSASR